MKSRLNLTIDENLLRNTKLYAERQNKSLSELVEGFFEKVTKPEKKRNFIDIVKELGPHNIDSKADLKELYYQDKKHGG